MKPPFIHVQEGSGILPRPFRTGVSLHSHTLHSKESLNFIYHASRKSALLRAVLRHGAARYKAIHGIELDLNRGWWTPPLAPLDAVQVEATQIEGLGMTPLISLTDHDDLEAGMSLQAMDASRRVPISVEWSVPFGPTFFHIGVHNILPQHARMVMRCLEEFTANPNPANLGTILSDLHSNPATLIVFNHPLWDEKGIGEMAHRVTVEAFMGLHGEFIHAMEFNGLRPWSENRAAIELAQRWRRPIVSGGDRHAVEPNAVINLSDASTFAEFVHEVRVDGHSQVLVLEHYNEAHVSRLFHNMLDVFRTYDDHGRGWTNWGDRVFFTSQDGSVRSLAQFWGDQPPTPVAIFAGFMRLAGQSHVRGALRAAAQVYGRG